MATPGEDVYCTLLMSDSYLPGAAVLAHSLRDAGTKKKLAVLVTLDTLSAGTITELKELYDYLIPVDRIRNPNPANLYLMDRADLAFAFTKIALWRQVQFRKIVYLDADVVVLRAPDELFNIDAPFAAAPDVGWPDAFNTGVMVISPNMGDYWALQTMAASGDSFDGADQGLLNQYYEHRNWHRISFAYNCTPNAQYQWEPAYRHYKSNISMVHFIGKDKPWSKGRQSKGGGVYNELLARWWAVYDRHLKGAQVSRSGGPASFSQPQTSYTPSLGSLPSTTVQQHVHGEATNVDFGTSSFEHITPAPETAQPEAATTTTEQPFSDPGETSENIDQGVVEPTPTAQQRKFSALTMSWDATRSAPPVESKPEAANFPVQTYTFSEDRELFQAPQSYPEPPRDMWYEVPETKPAVAERPKPIFPWEKEHDLPKPTRVFAEDLPPEPTPPAPTSAPSSGERAEEGTSTPPSSAQPTTTDENWQSFSQSTNAWDTVPGIEQYVRAIIESQQRRTKPQVLQQLGGTEEILSPSIGRKERRESLILTDFPSAVERPSLPVTPAPIRRPTFWGEERDAAGELPAAEGVPDQVDWNPEEKLEQLRRSSLLEFEHLTQPEKKQPPPLRELPEHSVPTPRDKQALHHHIEPVGGDTLVGLGLDQAAVLGTGEPQKDSEASDGKSEGSERTQIAEPTPVAAAAAATTTEEPIFKDPDFGADDATDERTGFFDGAADEGVISPTER